MKRFLAISLVLAPLAACSFGQAPESETDNTVVVTERPETKNVIYRGRILPLGTSIYMEGSHRLQLEDDRFVLLESDGLILNDYLNKDVEVFGSTRATIEGSAIIMQVERVANLVASSEMSSEASSSSSAPPVSSVAVDVISSAVPLAPVSRAPVLVLSSSVAPRPASSTPSVVISSIPASSVSSIDAAFQARVSAMAKANTAPANWTLRYCSTHVAFCIPVHKNWYYASFGATSSSLWHVELASDEEPATIGNGPLSIVLSTGSAPAPDGHVSIDGTMVTGIRAWTQNRHFVISGPLALEAAVRYITQELTSAPAASSSAVSL